MTRAFRSSKVLERVLNPNEFLSPYGVRSLSRYHLDHPSVFEAKDYRSEVKYLPGESDSDLFGGNSNWRGPIWMPINYLIVESLRKFDKFFGPGFKVEDPVGSGGVTIAPPLATKTADCLPSARTSPRPAVSIAVRSGVVTVSAAPATHTAPRVRVPCPAPPYWNCVF